MNLGSNAISRIGSLTCGEIGTYTALLRISLPGLLGPITFHRGTCDQLSHALLRRPVDVARARTPKH